MVMEESIKQKMEALWRQAQQTGVDDIKVTLTSGGESSLGKVIKTKEQADIFMKLLKALHD